MYLLFFFIEIFYTKNNCTVFCDVLEFRSIESVIVMGGRIKLLISICVFVGVACKRSLPRRFPVSIVLRTFQFGSGCFQQSSRSPGAGIIRVDQNTYL